mgnify:CR=1 FL=1
MARHTYRNEHVAATTIPFLMVSVEATVIGVLARKAFDGVVPDAALNTTVAILAASTAFANITSFLWVRLGHGRDKIKFINALHIAMALVVLALAAIPTTPVGLILLAAGVVIARIIWSGTITTRSTVWAANYPRSVRGTIAGKLATVQVLAIAFLAIGLGEAMDRDERAFRVLIPIGVAISFVGIAAWSRVRVRNHRALIRAEAENAGPDGPSANPLRIYRTLRNDHPFAGYMGCMFFLGLGNLMVAPLMAIVVKERFDMGYLGGMLVTSTIPLALMPFVIPLWARLLDRTHIITFRVYHGWVFVAANALTFVACLMPSIPLLYAGSVMRGLAFGGGILAWNLGHLDFAPKGRETEYMGVHVTLTGLRGLLAPFLGVAIYEKFELLREGAGAYAFLFCTILTIIGALGFIILTRIIKPQNKHHDTIEPTPPSRAGSI